MDYICIILYKWTLIKKIVEQSFMFSYEGAAFGLCDGTIRCMMLLIAAFLINNIIINEYNKNTMDIIFLCPVDRKKIIRIKVFLVILLTSIGLVIGQIFTAEVQHCWPIHWILFIKVQLI